jgi:8-oxo-dGTP diphosphatase
MAYSYNYPRMLVTVDSVVFLDNNDDPLRILLVKRGNDPYKGAYALPGGFPEMDELLVDAAKRELLEETGLSGVELKQLAAFDAIGRDPRDRNIAVVYFGFTTTSNCKLIAGDDAAEAQWFPINELPPLAFDHKEVIERAIEQINH